jgi:hypothetical protein
VYSRIMCCFSWHFYFVGKYILVPNIGTYLPGVSDGAECAVVLGVQLQRSSSATQVQLQLKRRATPIGHYLGSTRSSGGKEEYEA